MLLVNLVSAIEGEAGEFLRAEYATLRQVFPQVLVFAVLYPNQPGRPQNVVLVALPSAKPIPFDDPSWSPYLGHLWRASIPSDMPVLTDEFAPVDQYATRQWPAEPH